MCGRYRLKDPKAAFDWLEVAPAFDFRPRFNIAPTQRVPVVTGKGAVQEMGWGIVPAWAKETSNALINARCESVRAKRSFKSPFAQRRCLMPADGFYEWSNIGKQPYFFAVRQGAPFAIGAFWDEARDGPRCCLITTSPNAVLRPIHDRMPVIVRPEDWEEWLSPAELDDESFQRIMTPYAAEETSALAVSPLVNSARVDDPRCCEPAEPGAVEAPRSLKITRKKAAKEEGQQTFGF